MSEHLTRDEFKAHMEPLRDDIRELIALQREANRRVGKAETRIAVLEERTPPSKVASGVSAAVSAIISGLGIWISSHK